MAMLSLMVSAFALLLALLAGAVLVPTQLLVDDGDPARCGGQSVARDQAS